MKRKLAAAAVVTFFLGGLYEATHTLQAQKATTAVINTLNVDNPLDGLNQLLLQPSIIRGEEQIEAIDLLIQNSLDSREYKDQLTAFGLKDTSSPWIAAAMVDIGEARINDLTKVKTRIEEHVLSKAESPEASATPAIIITE